MLRIAAAARSRQILLCATIVSQWLVITRARADRFQLIATVGFGDEYTALGLSHRDPNTVLIGTNHGKIHRSIDGGATWQDVVVTPFRDFFFGRERHDDPRLEYALGLPGKSPHLQRWLRNKGLRTSGLSMQQFLVAKGDKSVTINWIEVDWHDENRIFLGTIDGLYRSHDKARTFVRMWQGRSSLPERIINAVVTNPADPTHLLMGTSNGLFVSHDRGATFRKEMNFYIRDSMIRGLYFDTQSAGLLHMAMGGAAMATPDSGKNWITTYWHLWRPRSDVRWIALGPNNIRALATGDGIYASFQGGEYGTWKRRGSRFTGIPMVRVELTNDPKIWYALSEHAVWRTSDTGATWHKIMQMGSNEFPRWLQAFQGDEGRLWLLTNRRLFTTETPAKLRSLPNPPAPSTEARKLLDLPPLSLFWRKAVDYKHLYFGDHQRYRNRAPWAAFLPSLTLSGGYDFSRESTTRRVAPYIFWPYLNFISQRDSQPKFEVLFQWDLGRTIFDRRQLSNFGRVARNMEHHLSDLSERIYRLYVEYKRLAHRLVFQPPTDQFVLEMKRIRLREIAAFFDSVSGGYWSKTIGAQP